MKKKTSAPIGVWKVKREIMRDQLTNQRLPTDRPTYRPTGGQTGSWGSFTSNKLSKKGRITFLNDLYLFSIFSRPLQGLCCINGKMATHHW